MQGYGADSHQYGELCSVPSLLSRPGESRAEIPGGVQSVSSVPRAVVNLEADHGRANPGHRIGCDEAVQQTSKADSSEL